MNSKTNLNRAGMIAYWVTTGFVALAFFITGIGNLIPITHIAHDMAHLGYPSYFHIILGTWKVLGAVVIVFPKTPRMKEWAYAGMMFDLTGAAFSRLASSDSIITIIIPIVIGILVVISWAVRPEERKLKISAK